MCRRLALVLLVAAAAEARAETPMPTHLGESGLLDVPSADVLGKAGAAFALDLRYLQSRDTGRTFVPSPLVMAFGLGRMEGGLSLRQGGLPGDSRPPGTVPAGVGKVAIAEARGFRPALAADLFLDHINRSPDFYLRGIASTERRWRMRLTAMGGGVIGIDRPSGWTAGAGFSVQGPRRTEFVADFLRQPTGRLGGVGVRWQPWSQLGLAASGSYLPDDARTWLLGVTVAFLSPAPVKPTVTEETEKPPEEAKPKPGKQVFTSDRPRFPLAIRQRPLPGGEGGPAPHYPGNASALPGAPEAQAGPRPRPAAAPAPAVKQAAPPPMLTDLTLPVMRADRIVQRKAIAAVIISLLSARVQPTAQEREVIARLAARAAAGEGDLVVWATTMGANADQLIAAVGRAVAIQRLAAKSAHLPPAQIGIQVGPGEAAARNRLVVALLMPEAVAAPTQPVEPAATAPPPVAPTPVTPTAPIAPEALAAPPDASAPAPAEKPDAAPASLPDAQPAAAPDAAADLPPARVERPVLLPPTLKAGAGGEDQLGRAIASFQPALKECVDRALKRDPRLRGEAQIVLDIQPSGRVKVAKLESKTLASGWFADCVRRAAEQWRMPRTTEGYRVQIPLKIHVANGGKE